MYEVTIKIDANPSKYWGKMEYQDKLGNRHHKEIEGERSASKQSNTLEALICCLRALKTPCMLSIYSQEDYIVSAFQQGWVTTWEKNSWKSARGHTVRNVEQWKEIWELLKPHSRRVTKGPD